MTLAAWLDAWIASSLPASDRKQAPIDLYSTVARKHLAPALGGRRLDRIRPSDVEALIVTKRAAGLAPSTVRTIYTVLRAALEVAVRDGLFRGTRLPLSAARPWSGKTPPTSPWTTPIAFSSRCEVNARNPCSV